MPEESTIRVTGGDGAEDSEEMAIRFLLDGLAVPTIRELYRLVECGRRYDQFTAFFGDPE